MKENMHVKNWYEHSYLSQGMGAQRKYPNEELLRFLARAYGKCTPTERKKTKILEVGCGSCANLWAVAKEGFEAYGMDLSEASIELGQQMLDYWGVEAAISVGDMIGLPYPGLYFEAVVDVFSSNCLPELSFKKALREIARVLKPGGTFFTYTPHCDSGAFQDFHPAKKIDDWTLNGIYRKDSPYAGNHYPFRFESEEHLTNLLQKVGLQVTYSERVSRSYNSKAEEFVHLVTIARKS